MIAHGLDLGPYTCLAAAFREPHPEPQNVVS